MRTFLFLFAALVVTFTTSFAQAPAAQAKHTDQVKAVLTPEQYTKFDQLKDEQRDKMRERRLNGTTTPPNN